MEQVRGEPMPVTTMADLGHHNKKRDIVRFFMQNETKERIRVLQTMLDWPTVSRQIDYASFARGAAATPAS
jgi:hypothetical protein